MHSLARMSWVVVLLLLGSAATPARGACAGPRCGPLPLAPMPVYNTASSVQLSSSAITFYDCEVGGALQAGRVHAAVPSEPEKFGLQPPRTNLHSNQHSNQLLDAASSDGQRALPALPRAPV